MPPAKRKKKPKAKHFEEQGEFRRHILFVFLEK